MGNTYNWAVNALGIKAASRFQLPLLDTSSGGDAEGMGWLSEVTASDYELVDGEMYFDLPTGSVLGRTRDTWFQFIQPETVELNAGGITWDASRGKNLVYTNGNAYTITLDTALSKVAPGSIVRVYHLATSINSLTIVVGANTIVTLASNTMAEFLFWVDDHSGSPGVGTWIATQKNLSSSKKP